MTKKKFELKVKKEVKSIQEGGEINFRASIIYIDDIKQCDNDGEAMVQINLDKGTGSKSSIVSLLYFKKNVKKEAEFNRKILLQNKGMYNIIKEFKGYLSEELLNNEDYPEVVDETIATTIHALYRDGKKVYISENLGDIK
ncbi:hypothetical protein [Halomonas hibernica]|uniref:hypothetical protein n=1 Tax=Halomonas hibernica TaxID=2591147 RepID=UPI001551F02F|nr:hypothetical protein [Halomonas hibernica]